MLQTQPKEVASDEGIRNTVSAHECNNRDRLKTDRHGDDNQELKKLEKFAEGISIDYRFMYIWW